jgi:phosphate transport system substrate-binding protein
MFLKSCKSYVNPWTVTGSLAALTASIVFAVPAVQSQGTATVKIDGSSTVYPITEAVAEEFQTSKKGAVRVTVGVSGTGGGFEKFCSTNASVRTDISNASRPIKPEEQQKCKAVGIEYIELPIALDGITVVVHPNNRAVTDLSTAELKKIWSASSQGSVTKWNQIRSSLPNTPFKLFGPGADSGTFDYFNEEILGKGTKSRTDYTPSENDNTLVQGVASNTNALGYFGYSYYVENKTKVKAVKINGVLPTDTTINNGTYKPLSRPVYIYVNKAATNKPEVKDFVNFYLNNAPRLVKEVRYIPLPTADYTKVKTRFANRQVGRVPLRAGL